MGLLALSQILFFVCIQQHVVASPDARPISFSLSSRQATNVTIEPPLEQFVTNQSAIDALKVFSNNPPLSLNYSESNDSSNIQGVIETNGNHDRKYRKTKRYLDVGECRTTDIRRKLRRIISHVPSMLRDAQSIETSHPVWRALYAPSLVDNQPLLARVRSQISAMYDVVVNPKNQLRIGCSDLAPACLKSEPDPKAPGGRWGAQAEWLPEQGILNVCPSRFFFLGEFENLRCIPGLPMSRYQSSCKSEIKNLHMSGAD